MKNNFKNALLDDAFTKSNLCDSHERTLHSLLLKQISPNVNSYYEFFYFSTIEILDVQIADIFNNLSQIFWNFTNK